MVRVLLILSVCVAVAFAGAPANNKGKGKGQGKGQGNSQGDQLTIDDIVKAFKAEFKDQDLVTLTGYFATLFNDHKEAVAKIQEQIDFNKDKLKTVKKQNKIIELNIENLLDEIEEAKEQIRVLTDQNAEDQAQEDLEDSQDLEIDFPETTEEPEDDDDEYDNDGDDDEDDDDDDDDDPSWTPGPDYYTTEEQEYTEEPEYTDDPNWTPETGYTTEFYDDSTDGGFGSGSGVETTAVPMVARRVEMMGPAMRRRVSAMMMNSRSEPEVPELPEVEEEVEEEEVEEEEVVPQAAAAPVGSAGNPLLNLANSKPRTVTQGEMRRLREIINANKIA